MPRATCSDGAHVCEGLFKHVVNPDGTVSHYYYHNPLYEQVPEDTHIIPVPPSSLEDLMQDSFPRAPDLPHPLPCDGHMALSALPNGTSRDAGGARGGAGAGAGAGGAGAGAGAGGGGTNPLHMMLGSITQACGKHSVPTWARCVD